MCSSARSLIWIGFYKHNLYHGLLIGKCGPTDNSSKTPYVLMVSHCSYDRIKILCPSLTKNDTTFVRIRTTICNNPDNTNSTGIWTQTRTWIGKRKNSIGTWRMNDPCLFWLKCYKIFFLTYFCTFLSIWIHFLKMTMEGNRWITDH